jgi:hypothetical protein
MAGNCYERTPRRTGIKEDGSVSPDGVVQHWTDPDIEFNGIWTVAGKIERIDLNQNRIYIRDRGGDMIYADLKSNSPYFYARLARFVTNVPWREAKPEIRPVLGRDIIPGDYIYIGISDAWLGVRNNQTNDENYRAIIENQARYGAPLAGYVIMILQ